MNYNNKYCLLFRNFFFYLIRLDQIYKFNLFTFNNYLKINNKEENFTILRYDLLLLDFILLKKLNLEFFLNTKNNFYIKLSFITLENIIILNLSNQSINHYTLFKFIYFSLEFFLNTKNNLIFLFSLTCREIKT